PPPHGTSPTTVKVPGRSISKASRKQQQQVSCYRTRWYGARAWPAGHKPRKSQRSPACSRRLRRLPQHRRLSRAADVSLIAAITIASARDTTRTSLSVRPKIFCQRTQPCLCAARTISAQACASEPASWWRNVMFKCRQTSGSLVGRIFHCRRASCTVHSNSIGNIAKP
ncbi:MAG: hypothetical protein ACI8W7_004342, partial [Gammaproteobacteria bacterium]